MLIQKLRLQRGWSQEQLAEISGLSVRTVQRLERGQTASLESLKALGAAFGVDLSALQEPEMNTTADLSQNPNTSPGVRPDEALALAHVRKLKEFYIHLGQYCATIVFLAVLNYLTWRGQVWVVWVAVAWGIALAFHALTVFDRIPFLTVRWEREQVEKYLGRRL
jgi:transcriptional regulator with XRE-family HTH domain